jgi:hypothetical protein
MRIVQRTAFVIVAAAVTALALAAVSGTASSPQVQRAVAVADGPTYTVFERPRAASDTLPRSVVEEFSPDGPAGKLGIDPSTARLLFSAAGESIFVVRGGGRVCAVRATPDTRSTVCRPETKEFMALPHVVPEVSGDAYRIWGVLPDGARADTISSHAAGKTVVAARGGAFSVEVKEPASFEWTASDGRKAVQPLKMLPEVE